MIDNTVLSEYQSTLGTLKEKCADAEKRVISLESDLRNLEQRREEYIAKCEQYAGVPYADVEKVLEQKAQELKGIMDQLSGINFDANTLTDDDVNKMKNIVEKFSSATEV
jgi:prefoldin subunit 5